MPCREEALKLDPERLAAVCLEMDKVHGPDLLAAAMRDLSETVLRAKGWHRAGRRAELGLCADRIAAIAEPVGLDGLARVAGDVAALSRAGDRVALAATLARLDRIASRSAKVIWLLREMSG
ncbi:MAG: hypothetical protein ACP5DX_08875 [Paracoccaceae bacterium]